MRLPPDPPAVGSDLLSQLHQQLWDWRATYPACSTQVGRGILLRSLKGDINQWQLSTSSQEAPSPLPQPVMEALREAANAFHEECDDRGVWRLA